VSLFLNGVGVTSPPVVTATGATAVAVVAMTGAIQGVWQVQIQLPADAPAGGNQIALTAGGVPVRDGDLVIWVN
jgi:uncharacterized protein (TIGR03437 family)